MNKIKSSDISIESPIVPIKLTIINNYINNNKINRVKKYRVFSSF